MMSTGTLRLASAALVVVLLAAALGAQAYIDSSRSSEREVTAALGDTAYAYLVGLRKFAAYVAWARLDEQWDEYYAFKPEGLGAAQFMLPTFALVTWLDHDFVEAYYTGPWILRRSGLTQEAYELAEEGLRYNPDAGILIAQMCQFEYLDGDMKAAYEYALDGLSEDVVWKDGAEKFEGYGVFRAVFEEVGDQEHLELVVSEMERLRGE